MNNATNNEQMNQQSITSEQAFTMAVARLKKADESVVNANREYESAKFNLYDIAEQVGVATLNAERQNQNNKIEELENENTKKVEKTK